MIVLLCLLLVSSLHIIATHALLTRKKTIKYCIIAFLLNSLFFLATSIIVEKNMDNSIISKSILYFLAFTYIIYIYLVFEESISKKLFAMFTIWMFSTIILFIATSMFDTFFGKVDANTTRVIVYIIRICIEALTVPLVYLVLGKPYKKVMGITTDKTINFMSLYPIIAFLVLIKNNTVSFGNYKTFNSEYDVLLVSVFIGLGYMLIFAGITSSSKVVSLQYNYRIIEDQIELQRQNYKKLSESIEIIYTIKHDIRHHFSAIKTMVEEGNNTKALVYIEQFNKSEMSNNISTLCDNFVADSIIKYYMNLAISRGIDFNTHINIPEDIGINSLDLCVVLGNSLDNAIDACDKLKASEERYIELNSKVVGSNIIFNIANSFNGNVEKTNDVIKSSKGEPGHGIGLSSINETVNRYNGNVSYKYNKNEFKITIIMRIGM